MNEKTLQSFFENYLKSQKIQYKREFRTSMSIVDFNVLIDNKKCAIEVKSNKGKISNTLGQLILARKTFSHVYLLAPEPFLQKIEPLITGTKILKETGLITIKGGKFVFTKDPDPLKYYFNYNPPKRRKTFPQDRNYMTITDYDYRILVNYENKMFNVIDIMKKFNVTRVDAYKRIERLLKVGLIEELFPFNPKSYRVTKIVDWGTKFSLSTQK